MVYKIIGFLCLLILAHCLVCLMFLLCQYGDYDKEFHTPGFLAKDLLLPQRVSTHCILSLVFCLNTRVALPIRQKQQIIHSGCLCLSRAWDTNYTYWHSVKEIV